MRPCMKTHAAVLARAAACAALRTCLHAVTHAAAMPRAAACAAARPPALRLPCFRRHVPPFQQEPRDSHFRYAVQE